MTEHFYNAHLFCCINERAEDHPRGSCARRGSVELQQHLKARSKELGMEGIRVNKAGCLDRCELGPVMVIYPEGAWYGINSTGDIDLILERHVKNGEQVDHLLLANDQVEPNPPQSQSPLLSVTQAENLTQEIKLFELKAADGGQLPAFTAGAHIDLKFGDNLQRSYSLANSPTERERYVIAVLDEPDGRGGSRWLHEHLGVGDTMEFTSPINNFELAEDAREHLFIAGGIGITPILAMGRHLKQIGAKAHLHYCTKSPEQTAFTDEVRDAFGEGLTFHHDGGDPSKGIDLAATLKTRPEGAHLYICGPRGLIDAAKTAAAHWPGGTVHFELFSGAEEARQEGDESFTVVLERSGMTLSIPAGKSILDAVREAGVDAASSCESGICGTCQTDLLGGEAEHRDEILSPAEQDSQTTIMICMSRAKPGETLILDL